VSLLLLNQSALMLLQYHPSMSYTLSNGLLKLSNMQRFEGFNSTYSQHVSL